MNPDVVIVGAGAAGIGAGLALQAQGIPFIIVEAAGRAGGRAYTDAASLPVPWDHGCHWLHCADVNPLVEWADKLGATYRKRKWDDHFAVWAGRNWQNRAVRDEASAALNAGFEAIYASARRGEDRPIEEVLPDLGVWTPSVRYFLQLMACDDLDRISTLAYGDYVDTDLNWPVTSGYGNLIASMAEGLPIKLNTQVKAVNQGAGAVQVETTNGQIEAKAAILTASTNILLSDEIRISDGPARALLDLMHHVPCGTYEKAAIALKRLPPEVDEKFFFTVDPRDGSMPQDFQIASADPPLLIAHMAGSLPRELGRDGPEAMIDYAVERLALALGSDVRKEIIGTRGTSWQHDPHIRGAYSYTRPGHAQARRDMIATETGNVAFAGEAFSLQWQATAHGAYQSGRDVAARLVRECKLAA